VKFIKAAAIGTDSCSSGGNQILAKAVAVGPLAC